jgi:cell wall-associated NlpC family hydrolase
MAKSNYDSSLSTLGALGLMCGATAALFLMLYWLMQPKVLGNPGLAAYHPPPGTRLVPIPRKSDAPELASLPESSGTSFAEAPVLPIPAEPTKPAKPAARERSKKVAAAKPRRNIEREPTYAQQQWGAPQRWGFASNQRRPEPWSWF